MSITFKPKQMIQPGQKLKEGDFVKDITGEQAKELMEIDHTGFPEGYEILISKNGVKYWESWNGLFAINDSSYIETEYNFTDFKQLCDNTFNTEL